MRPGKVYLIGAGPGDPELLTLKGRRLLRIADVVVYDRLIDKRLLEHCKPDAELVDVGKVPGERGRTQARINSLLVNEARAGKQVVRLKGGDPFVFGRGGEEAESLRDAGVPFQISPGVTSAVAAPAYAGIPLTHREYGSSFTIMTGSVAADAGNMEPDWSAAARMPGALVILMGWRRIEEITSALIAAGKPGNTPAAVVSRGATAEQKSVFSNLDSIAEAARREGLEAPAAIVVGEVVRLHDRLNWYENLPLFGRRVMITRASAQARGLSERLTELGACPVEVPTIEIRALEDFSDLDSCLRALSQFDWIAFTSANAVRAVCDRLFEIGADIRSLHPVNIAAIGSATSTALMDRGVAADMVSETASSIGLASDLEVYGIRGKAILLPRSDIATADLPDRLRSKGAVAREVNAYRTVIPPDSKSVAREAIRNGVHAITFASSSSVENMIKFLDGDISSLRSVAVACIGPSTAQTAGRYGLKVDIVAKETTSASLAEALVEYFSEN